MQRLEALEKGDYPSTDYNPHFGAVIALSLLVAMNDNYREAEYAREHWSDPALHATVEAVHKALSELDAREERAGWDVRDSLKLEESACEVAEGFFEHIRRNAEAGQPKKWFPKEASIGLEVIKDEWIYFDVFVFDYVTFHAFGETAARHAVLDPFEFLVANWLKARQAPPTPIRMCFYPDDIKVFPAEEREPASERLKRRMAMYAEAVQTPNASGVNYMVALTFATLCGIEDVAEIVGISTFFCHGKLARFNILKSLCAR